MQGGCGARFAFGGLRYLRVLMSMFRFRGRRRTDFRLEQPLCCLPAKLSIGWIVEPFRVGASLQPPCIVLFLLYLRVSCDAVNMM